VTALEALYRDAYAHLRKRAGLRARRTDFRVRFYPYAGLTSTIFKRREHFEVRLADLLEHAPMSVHYSLALVLIAKIDGRFRVTPAEQEVYEAWSRQPDVLKRHGEVRRRRGRKRMLSPEGKVYDLRALYRRLNREYFDALLPEVELGWSEGSSRTRFGHHDEDLGSIVLNRRLDSKDVPRRVVAYVLYHEMLHVRFGIGMDDAGRRVMHPPAFKREERRFPAYRSAERLLARMAAGRRRHRPRRAAKA
jgi:predicted metal-dependent hydrolase